MKHQLNPLGLNLVFPFQLLSLAQNPSETEDCQTNFDLL